MLKVVLAIVALALAVAIVGPAVAGGSGSTEAAITAADESQLEESAPPGPVDDLGAGEAELSPPGPVDDLGSGEAELSPPGPVDDLGGEVAPVASASPSPPRAAISLAPPMDPAPDVSASPDAGLPLPRVRTQQQVVDEPDTESHRTPGGGAARLAATPFDAPVAPRVGITHRVAGAR